MSQSLGALCLKVEVAVQGSPVPNSPYGLCGCKENWNEQAQELCESGGGRPGLPVPNSLYYVAVRHH